MCLSFQLGGDFLLDSAGKVLLSHPSKNPLDRLTVEDVLQTVDSAGQSTNSAHKQKLWNSFKHSLRGKKSLNASLTPHGKRSSLACVHDVTPYTHDIMKGCDWCSSARQRHLLFCVASVWRCSISNKVVDLIKTEFDNIFVLFKFNKDWRFYLLKVHLTGLDFSDLKWQWMQHSLNYIITHKSDSDMTLLQKHFYNILSMIDE